MRVVWSAAARRDRNSIFTYVAERNSIAAVSLDERSFAAAASLDVAAERGRPDRVPGTRELAAIAPYVIIYRVDEGRNRVRILGIAYGVEIFLLLSRQRERTQKPNAIALCPYSPDLAWSAPTRLSL